MAFFSSQLLSIIMLHMLAMSIYKVTYIFCVNWLKNRGHKEFNRVHVSVVYFLFNRSNVSPWYTDLYKSFLFLDLLSMLSVSII